MASTRTPSYVNATRRFLKGADWLTAADEPARAMLLNMAAELDRAPTSSMVAQYRMAYAGLLKREPGAAVVDPVDDLIDDLRS